MVKQSKFFSILMKKIARYVVSLPLFGVFFAVVWSVVFDFESATATHCHVRNYLPSVSAAISRTPQSHVWRACVALHATPRYMLACCYWKWFSFHEYHESRWFFAIQPLKILAFGSNIVELTALLGLTLVSSIENFMIHKTCFGLFIIGSLFCMISMCLLNTMIVKETEYEKTSARRKRAFLVIKIAALFAASYFYYRHNALCEPIVYTFFALSEYVVILANMAFHYTASLDYDGYSLCVIDNDGRKL